MKYALVLEKCGRPALRPSQPAGLRLQHEHPAAQFATLSRTLIRDSAAGFGRVVVLAPVSGGPKAAAVARLTAADAASRTSEDVLLIYESSLPHPAALHAIGTPQTRQNTELSNLWVLDEGLRIMDAAPAGQDSPRAGQSPPSEPLQRLRESYGLIVFAAESVSQSNWIPHVLPYADGVVLSVEAGRTSVSEVLHARRQIEDSGGALLGCVIFDRKYSIPKWLYQLT